MPTIKLPIVISGPMKEQLMALLRYLLLILATSLVAKHWLPIDTDVQQLVGIIMGLVTAGWSQSTVRKDNAIKQTLEKYAPDEVATTSVPVTKQTSIRFKSSGVATFVVLGLALLLAGCGPMLSAIGLVPPAPVAVAQTTKLDEQVALSVELAYKGARLAVSTGIKAGLIKGALAGRIAAADDTAYKAVVAVRAAYDAGNAASYDIAAERARAAIADIITLTLERK